MENNKEVELWTIEGNREDLIHYLELLEETTERKSNIQRDSG